MSERENSIGLQDAESRRLEAQLSAFSKYSLLDNIPAASSPEQLVHKAKDLGYTTLALTDSNFFGLVKFMQSAQEEGIRAGVGLRMFAGVGLRKMPVTVLAQNRTGLVGLFAINNQQERENKVIDIDDLYTNLDGNVVLLEGTERVLADLLEHDNTFYVPQSLDPKKLLFLPSGPQQELFKKLVIAPEVRMHDASLTDVLRFTDYVRRIRQGTKKGLELAQPLDYSDLQQYALQDPASISRQYRLFPDSIELTNDIGRTLKPELPERVKVKAKSVPQNQDSFHFLERVAFLNAADRNIDEKLTERLREELAVVKMFDFADYILICREIAAFCKERGIYYLITGSGNNSFLLQTLGITQTEAQDLDYRRFINQERPDLPDVDFYLPFDRISEVTEWLTRRYDEATMLAVIHTLRRKGIIELHTKYRIPITSNLMEKVEAARLPLRAAKHSSGVILSKAYPQTQTSGEFISQLTREDVEELDIAKFDILSHLGPARFEQSMKLLAQDGYQIVIKENDAATFERIFRADNPGISEIESPHLHHIIEEVGKLPIRPTLETIAEILAVARPATSIETYIAYVKGLREQPIITQDDVMQRALSLGLTLADANQLRKMMSEQYPIEKRQQLLEQVYQRAIAQGYTKDAAQNVVEQMESFRSYGFVHGHARALARLVYDLSFIAAHYPLYFWGGVMSVQGEKPSQLYPTQAYINAMMRDNVHFAFETVDQIPPSTVPRNGVLVLGKDLLSGSDMSIEYYNRLYSLLKSGEKPDELIKYQLRVCDTCFTHNPIELFPVNLRFNSYLNRQVIVGQPCLKTDFKGGDVTPYIYVTLDSGRLLSVRLSQALIERKGKFLYGQRFWHLNIKRSNNGYWEVVDILDPMVV